MINGIPALIDEYRDKVDRTATQSDIADGIGLDPGLFSRYVNARVGGFKFDLEYKICRFFSRKLGRVVLRDDLYTFDAEELMRDDS